MLGVARTTPGVLSRAAHAEPQARCSPASSTRTSPAARRSARSLRSAEASSPSASTGAVVHGDDITTARRTSSATTTFHRAHARVIWCSFGSTLYVTTSRSPRARRSPSWPERSATCGPATASSASSSTRPRCSESTITAAPWNPIIPERRLRSPRRLLARIWLVVLHKPSALFPATFTLTTLSTSSLHSWRRHVKKANCSLTFQVQ